MSDSQSVLQALCSNPLKYYKEDLIIKTRYLIYQIHLKYIRIIHIWAKRHCGIMENEIMKKQIGILKKHVTSASHTLGKAHSTILLMNVAKGVTQKWKEL